MKKVLLLAVCALAISFNGAAQNMSENAIGLKFGGNAGGDFSGTDIQVSYQKALSTANRLEANLDFSLGDDYNSFILAGYYQWVWAIEGNFNWFAAPGANLGFVSVKNGGSDMLMGIGGQVGVEYKFPEIPLMLSFDITPTIGLLNSQGFYNGFGFGVRYCF